MSARSVLSIAVLALLLPVLTACETVDRWVDGGDHITVKNAPASATKAEPALPVYGSKLPTEDELRGLTRKMSGGSVEVYDIDDGPSSNQSMISIAPQYDAYPANGMAYPSDPSVTVFPLDDFGGMYPPPAVGGPIPMTPAPFGADVPDPSIGGKLHSSAGKDVSRVYFDYGSDRIGSGDDRVLSEAAETAKFAPVDRVRVEGHASIDSQVKDPVKARILNLEESLNRAYKVSRRLIEKGVPAEKIKTVGWGDTVLAGGAEQQRRVDIITSAGY